MGGSDHNRSRDTGRLGEPHSTLTIFDLDSSELSILSRRVSSPRMSNASGLITRSFPWPTSGIGAGSPVGALYGSEIFAARYGLLASFPFYIFHLGIFLTS